MSSEIKYANGGQLAKLLNVSSAEFKRLLRYGMPRVSRDKYLITECVKWYMEHLKFEREHRSTHDIASMFGVSERRVDQLVTEHGIPKRERGVYNLPATVLAYVNLLKEQIKEAKGGKSLADERRRLVKHQADLKEIELLEKQRELIPVDEVRSMVLEMTNLFGKKLDALPGTVMNKVYGAKSKEEVLEILRDAVKKVRKDLTAAKSRRNVP